MKQGSLEYMQALILRYRKTGLSWPPTLREIAVWVLDNDLWSPGRSALVKQCASLLGQAMRADIFTDPQGRRVRAKHAARIERDGRQITLWDDMRNATSDHMVRSFQQRREHILGVCRQLKTDIDSYNANLNKGRPIQGVFDFSLDLEEIQAARTYDTGRIAASIRRNNN
jgi:hypothetical protein